MAISTNGTVLTRLAGALYNTQMSNATYKEVAALDPSALANVLYARDFNTVSDATVASTLVTNLGLSSVAGLSNWVAAQLTAAGANKGAKVVELLNGFSQMSADATYGAAATAFNNKVDSALAMSQTTDNAGGTFSNISTAVVGKTFTLTTGSNNFTGSSGDDTFDAGLSTSSLQTLNSGDILDGGAGNDTLVATINGSATPTSLKSVEFVNITDITNAATVDLSNATGVLQVKNQGSTAALTLSGISKSVGVTVQDTSVQGHVITFNDVTGSADAATITVQNVTGANTAGTGTISALGIETLTIASAGSGANVISELTATQTTSLTVTGSANITLGTAANSTNGVGGDATELIAGIRTIDMSSASGTTVVFTDALAPTVTGGSGNDTINFNAATSSSVTGGAGNDRFNYYDYATGTTNAPTGTFSTAQTVNGGDGTDTLAGTAAQLTVNTTQTNVSNIERLLAPDAMAAGSNLNATFFGSGVNYITVAGTSTTPTITANTGATTVSFTAITGGDLTLVASGTATTDSVTILQSLTAGTTALGNNSITGTGVETLTISGAAGAASSISTITLTGTSAAATTLNLTGALSFTTSGAIEAKTIDASGMTMGASSTGLVMGAAASTNTAQTITGTPGNDTLIGGSGADSITGGTGNDVITSGAGNDTILGGEGNDTLTFGASFATGDSIDGGAGTDILSITSAGITVLNNYAISTVTALNDRVSNVERLIISDANTVSLDLARVDSINYARLNAANTATISGFGAAGTLDLRVATNTVTATLTDATGTADSFTVALNGPAATTDFGTVTVGSTSAIVETVNVTANEATALTAAQTYTIALADAGNTTVNFTGAENVVSTISSTSLNTLNLSGLTTGTSNITATASIANMTVTGSNQNDTVSAGSGNDSIIGGTGDDDLIGGAGADTIDGGTGNDTIIGGIGTDSLIGGDGTDTISAAYTLSTDGGGSAATGVVINLSSSAILSTTIATNASLATSSDILSVASNTLVNVGTAETVSTRVDSLSGFENITGSGGTDYLIGSSSANSISGGAGADYINPGLGADTITGGAAADTIVLTETTSSSDTVVFSGATTALNGADIITGFVLAADVLSFSSLTAGSLTATITAGTMATATALATETTSIALATNKVYVAQVATAAGIDTAAEVITAIADGGVLDALDVAANATAFLIVSGADVATSAYVYGIVNDATAATAAGELVLLGTITTDSNVFTASNFSF